MRFEAPAASVFDTPTFAASQPFSRARAIALALVFGLSALCASAAHALPSFARQLGVQCTACHTAFPQLTPFGREFKLKGYTLSAGQSRLPPLAMMLQGAPGFTHTSKGQPGGAAPGYNDNDNVSLNQVSAFYAGRLFGPYAKDLFGDRAGDALNHVGVFVQGTYDGVAKAFAWDNTEVRIATEGAFQGHDLVYGVYANNNPTLQDPWNTTPAWGYPFSGSSLAPAPSAAPLIAGGFAQQVAGAGVYGLLDHLFYVEGGAYTMLSAGAQEALGVDPSGETEIDGGAPYWRLALQKAWGSSNLEVGTYGLHAATFPGRDRSAGNDHFTDFGVDSQYQYLTGTHDFTVLANWIYEKQSLDASRSLGVSGNDSNHLWTLTGTGSYLYDSTYGMDFQYFFTDGSSDALLYGSRTGSPRTDGFIIQANYLPFNKRGGPSFWPASSVKLALQYTHYNHFDGASSDYDGSGRDASDNDTVYVQFWWAY